MNRYTQKESQCDAEGLTDDERAVALVKKWYNCYSTMEWTLNGHDMAVAVERVIALADKSLSQ